MIFNTSFLTKLNQCGLCCKYQDKSEHICEKMREICYDRKMFRSSGAGSFDTMLDIFGGFVLILTILSSHLLYETHIKYFIILYEFFIFCCIILLSYIYYTSYLIQKERLLYDIHECNFCNENVKKVKDISMKDFIVFYYTIHESPKFF